MATLAPSHKACAVNPLKSSQPLGAAFAFLGVEGAMPLFHGSQGCTSFALVLLVRHFKESIPLQTTAMDEIATILGGADHLEEALVNLKKRTDPKLIGICTTALVETRGEDFVGDLEQIRDRRASDLMGTEIVLTQTPDFDGSIEEGWAKAVLAMIEGIAARGCPGARCRERINILAGIHQTIGDLEYLRETIEAFGLRPVILPDISGALDGTIPESWIPTTYGGTSIEDIRTMARSACTIAIGEHMRPAALRLGEIGGAPVHVLPTLTGLSAADQFIGLLAETSGRDVPTGIRRKRSQLLDAMLDGHFFFGGKKIAIAAEPDLLFTYASLFDGLGAGVDVAVAATGHSPILSRVPAREVLVGDLMDFEERSIGCDLLVTHSHGRQASERLGIPLLRVGFPIFDRLGSQHRRTIGYEGTRDVIFEVANLFQAAPHSPTPEALNPFRDREDAHERRSPFARH